MLQEYKEATRAVDRIMKQQGVSVLLFGAMARDEYFKNCGEEAPRCRQTFDVDFACRVDSWKDYQTLTSALVRSGEFSPDQRCKHRFIHNITGVQVDLIPFGDIETPDRHILWPPDFEDQLNMRGVSEAARMASEIAVSGTDIRTVPPEWYAMMKLNSWLESPSRSKDIEDFHLVAANYVSIIGDDRLWGGASQDNDLCEQDDFDYDLAGVRILGRDCARADIGYASDLVGQILDTSQEAALISEMANLSAMYGDPADFWASFKEGIQDVQNSLG